jgi:hypothetical protein
MSAGTRPAGLHEKRSAIPERSAGVTVQQSLLWCGILYALLYPFVNDVVAVAMYDGYHRTSQAVSELSAVGAPSRGFLAALSPVFVLLLSALGVGIWGSGRGKRSIRLAGALVVTHGILSLLWLFAPMSDRDVIAVGGATSADSMHLVLAAATGLFVAAYVSTFAIGFGWRFRLYSVLTLATALVFGRLSAQVERIEAGDPTPYMGLLERIGMGAWLLWLAIASVVLLRQNRAQNTT